MQCPKCESSESVVQQTRKSKTITVRYRKCSVCGFHFKTREIPDQGGQLVISSVGVVDFDPALIKRTVREVGFTKDVSDLVSFVTTECFTQTNQVSASAIVMSTVRYLMTVDHCAALKLLITKGDPDTVELIRQTAVNLIGKRNDIN